MKTSRTKFPIRIPAKLRFLLASAAALLALSVLTACPRAFPGGEILEIASLTGVTTAPAASPAFTGKYVFVTAGGHDGDFATGFANAIAGADDFCANQKPAALPGTGTNYKAMLVDGTNRIACGNANCTVGGPDASWILLANTEYRRGDDKTVFSTNGNAVFDFGGGSLTTAFDDDVTPLRWWTGLNGDWQTTAVNHCVSWATNSGIAQGTFGSSVATDGNSVAHVAGLNGGANCNLLQRLLCVQQ